MGPSLVQVASNKTRVESAYGVCNQRLKLKYDKLVSSFGFNFNLRQYTQVTFADITTVAAFTSTKEAAFKVGLATDLKVTASQIAVTVEAARRHLLVGFSV